MTEADPLRDLGILLPDGEVTLANGERVTVREYRFLEGLQADAIAADLLADMQVAFGRDTAPEPAELAGLFGRHADAVSQLLAMATGQPLAWVDQLGDEDGQVLLNTWWAVNTGFFTRRLVQRIGTRRMLALRPAGAPSSPDSSATATPGAS